MGLIDNLISYWKLDEAAGNAVDIHSGHNGAVTGCSYEEIGKIGNAYGFGGDGDHIEVPHHSDFNLTNNFTITAWIKTNAFAINRRIFHKNGAYSLYLFESDNKLGFYHYGHSEPIYSNDNVIPSTGTWYHVVYTQSSTTGSRFYVNGSFVGGNAAKTGNVPTNANNIYIGVDEDESSFPWDGLLDEVAIWDSVLDGDDVTALWNGGDGLAYPFGASYESFAETKLSSSGLSITIDKPAGVVENDLMIVFISQSQAGEGREVTPPAGWVELVNGYYYGGAQVSCFYKIAGGSEPSDYTFTWDFFETLAYGFIMRFTGHKVSAPINVDEDAHGTSDAPECPSVTTTEDNCLVLRLFGADDIFITEDSGYPSEHTGITVDKSGATSSHCCGGAAYKIQSSAGPTGAAEFSMTDSENWVTVTIAIERASPPNIVTPSTLDLELALQTPSVIISPVVTPDALELALTQHAPVVSIDCTIIPDTFELALTQQAPVILFNYTATPDTFELALALQSPSLHSSYTDTPDVLALALTLQTPSVILSPVVTPDVLALALTLQTPTIVIPIDVTVTPSTLELALTLQVSSVSIDCTITPDALGLVLALQSPVIVLSPVVLPDVLALALTLLAPGVDIGLTVVTPDTLELEATLWTPEIITSWVDIPPFMEKDLIDPYSRGAWLWLVEIAVSGQDVQRIARNTENVRYAGEDFEESNFQVGEQVFSGDGSIPRVTLRIFQGVNRKIEKIINETEGALGASVKLIRVNERFLDSPVAALEADYDNLISESDTEWVIFTLGVPNPLTQRYPLGTYSSKICPEATPSLFKGPACQYTGLDGTCTGTYEDCYGKGNAVHWGGELGLDPNVLQI